MSEPIEILVADKSVQCRRLLRAAVERAGVPIALIEAVNGSECMRHLEKGGTDLAFVDIDLPELGNFDESCEASRLGRKTFIVAMSRPTSVRIFDLAENLKAFEYLIKPFGKGEILSVMAGYRRLANPKKVLVIDDLPSIRDIIGTIIGSSVYRLDIEKVADETSALARCGKTKFDIIFLDWDTSEPAALAFLEKLVDVAPQAKIVMVSVEHNPWQERGALRRGACAILHKPFYPADVEAILHAICGMDLSKLTARPGSLVGGFEVRIRGRTAVVGHRDSGRGWQFLWFRDQPYLRAGRVQEGQSSPAEPDTLRPEAEAAAVTELNRANLLNAVPQALAG